MGKMLGRRLRRARMAEGLTQKDVAEKIRVNQAQVSGWETGRSEPNESHLKRLARLLGDLSAPKRQRAEANEAEVEAEDDGEDNVSNAFGEWLRDTRKAAGLSRHELSDAAGVSWMAIRNIEAGKTQNPQEKTRKRLEKALNATVPEDITAEAVEERTIKGLGELSDFDPHAEDDLPTCAGVYVFYDISDRPIYIGQGQNISRRVKDHAEKFWYKRPIVNHAAYIEINDKDLRYKVEQVLIKFLKSNAVINKQSVERD